MNILTGAAAAAAAAAAVGAKVLFPFFPSRAELLLLCETLKRNKTNHACRESG
jgi:hypothetical protein